MSWAGDCLQDGCMLFRAGDCLQDGCMLFWAGDCLQDGCMLFRAGGCLQGGRTRILSELFFPLRLEHVTWPVGTWSSSEHHTRMSSSEICQQIKRKYCNKIGSM